MSSEGIFKTHAEYAVKVKFCGSEEEISLEELYQAFKIRLEVEQSNAVTEVVTKPVPISRHKQQAILMGVPAELWDEYLKTRKQVKASNTPLALTTLINKLTRFAEEGYSPSDLVEMANESGWKTIYTPKPPGGNYGKPTIAAIARHNATDTGWLTE